MKQLIKITLLCFFGFGISQVSFADDNVLVSPSVYVQSVNVGKKDYLPESIASASGIEDFNEHYYVVSDDSDYLYELDEEFEIISATNLLDKNRHSSDEALNYMQKADFESIAATSYNGQEIFLILGSGSSPTRNIGVIYTPATQEITRVNLDGLYTSFSDDVINIESVTFDSASVYIANRATNNIYIFDKDNLIDYFLDQTQELPEVKVMHVKLPSIGNYQSTLSSMYYSQEVRALFFSASVELSYGNPIFNGVVLGSFVGAVPIDDLADNLDLGLYSHLLVDESGVIQTKVESLVVSGLVDGKFSAVIVSDNDNGVSEIFDVDFFLSKV